MRQDHKMTLLGLCMVVCVLVLPSGALAKPKKIVLNGCTMEQVQSNFGKSCIDQASTDLLEGHSYYHTIICNGNEMQCCTKDTKTGAILTCRKPPFSRVMPGGQGPSSSGSVLSRGVEGAETSSEETPPPSWMTDAWLKENMTEEKPK